MADPALIDITPKDTWIKVATAVATGQIYRKSGGNFIQTIRDTGNPAPPNSPLTDQAPILEKSDTAIISSSNAIDVYIMCIGEVGKIRIDL